VSFLKKKKYHFAGKVFFFSFLILSTIVAWGFQPVKNSAGSGVEKTKGAVENLLLFSNAQSKFYPKDTTAVKDTSLADSVKLDPMALDSTARLKYFHYQRKDYFVVPFRQKKPSSFFLRPSKRFFKRSIELDSTGNYVIIRETIAGEETKELLKIPLDEYIKMRMKSVVRDDWEALAYKYEFKEDRNDLSALLTQITNIEIPLPSTGFLSIFGPPKISLRINGAVNIHGAWRNEKTEGLTASFLGNTRNEPDFKQEVQINVSGMIGDKLKISADWNTERTFEYENQLKIKYTGYDDEIIKSIEAGNVSLQTSSLVGGSEALFGVKAKFQLGPFSLTALASQKKSEMKEVSVSGGSEKQQFELHATEYAENHFFVDTVYASEKLNIFNHIYGNANPIIGPTENYYRIKDLEVWKTTTGIVNTQKERRGNAFLNLPGREFAPGEAVSYPDSFRNVTEEINGQNVIGGRFVKLTEGADYDYDPYAGFITFKVQIQPTDAIGVAYRIEGRNGPEDVYFGEFVKEFQSDTARTILLKLIKPPNLQPAYKQAWKLMLKNIYPLGGREINKEGFKLSINYVVPGQDPQDNLNGKKYVTIFGLDKTDESGTGTQPDGAFDFLPGKTIFPETGEIIFPVLEPFGRDLPKELPRDLAYNAVYDTTKTFAEQDKSKDKFTISGEYSASSSSVYQIGFNVVENSVKVYLNGRLLKEGVDYTVDYNIGQINIRNASALVPGANLKITYEQNDLFQLASKTLIGLRGLYEFNKKTRLGFSFMNLNQETLSDKVRIGEEPMSNSIMGVDFKTSIDLPFVTKGLNYLFSTKQMSSFSLKGEAAYISPDPNTKKSTIKSDKGKSIAYIDDFEGAKRVIPIGISYTGWHDLSVPDNMPLLPNIEKEEAMSYKAKSFWYNHLPSDVFVTHIWGNRKSVAREDRQVTVLDYVFNPRKRGMYNMNPKIQENYKQNWGGIMRLLSSTASNLVEENIQFIEFWIYVENAPPGAKMYIDLGEISEDVIPNGVLDTEDKNQNDLVDEGEDTGIDGLTDAQERALDTLGLGSDPAGDDFSFTLTSNPDYSRINGSEGNAALTDAGRLPNSEDLNHNFTLDRLNSYFRYEVPIDTTKNNPFVAGGGEGSKPWFLIRVPLKDYVEKIGSPTFTLVEYIRFWFEGVDTLLHIRLAELNLVGNQWRKVLVPGKVTEDDTVMTVSTINIEDNPNYTSPPGVYRERDRSKPDQMVYKNEQSLQLIVKGLEQGDKREIVKYPYKPLNIFNYHQMKLFVHGDTHDADVNSISHYDEETGYNAEVYFRFGTDSLNFYEYRQPVEPGWKEITIDFAELTSLKQARTAIDSFYQVPVKGKKGHFYGVIGNPSLRKISFFTFGVKNPKKTKTLPDDGRVYGELWVNELRLVGADDTPGWAYAASASIKLADLLTINANLSQTNPYFHKLADRFGSKVDKRSWGVSVDFDPTKLIPFNLKGTNFKVNYSHTEGIAKPLYKPGTDIKVEEAATLQKEKLIQSGVSKAEAEKITEQFLSDVQTVNISDTWTLNNIHFRIPSRAWYVEDIINNLNFGFNFNKRMSRNPTTLVNNSWVWNANARYSLNFSRNNFFYPANIPIFGALLRVFKDYRNVKVYFTPQSFNTSFSASRKYSYTKSRLKENSNMAVAKPTVQRDFTAKRSASLAWKITEGGFVNLGINYKLDIASSLAYLLTDSYGRERSEREIWREIFTSAFFGKDYSYNQTFAVQTKPKLPSLWNLDRYFNLNAGYNVRYNWKNNFNQKDLGRSASFSNQITAGLTLRLKSLTEPLFKALGWKASSGSFGGKTTRASFARNRGRRGRTARPPQGDKDKVKEEKAAKDTNVVRKPIYTRALEYLRDGIKWLLFDYESISLNFSENNSKGSSGLRGTGTGFTNFWGFRQQERIGPTRLFMLGLSYDAGPRAPNGNLQDRFTQNNNVALKTQRPLWEGANISINWNVGWGINKSVSITTDDYGNIEVTNIMSNGKIDRSFLTFPPFLMFDFGIKKVEELYKETGGGAGATPNASLSDAFVKGFETLPLLSKIPLLGEFVKYVPRPNWRITWNGLEKLKWFRGFAQSISLNHAYTSKYSESWKINPDGFQETQSQKISYGFTPLIGLNITFKQLWGGNMTGSFKYNTKANYDLGVTTHSITESSSRDISLTASFQKRGFKLPLFGLSLKNDIEISFSYTSGKNSTVIFDMDNFSENGKPQDGTTRTTLEPRVKYVMSSRVTLSVYYKRTTVEPEGASRIPPTITNEAGLDVNITIQ